MNLFNLTTWTGQGVAGYEPIIANSPEEAVAFAAGVLRERTRHDVEVLARLGVTYRLASGSVALADLASMERAGPDRIQIWALAETPSGFELKPIV